MQKIEVAWRTNNRFFAKVFDDRPFILHEPLFRYKGRNNKSKHTPVTLNDLEPRLAESYEASHDLLKYTVHLRRGILSHYGNECTSEDIKWSWTRAFKLRGTGRFTAKIAQLMDEDSIIIKDKYTIEFILDKPNITFPHFFTSIFIPIIDSREVKKHISQEDPWGSKWLKNHHASYGPFIVEKYDEQKDIVIFGPHSDYWCKGLPKIDKLIFRGVPSFKERLHLLKSGEIDIAVSVPIEEFEALSNEKSFQTMVIPSHDSLMLQMNCMKKPFDQVKVRKAISYAIPYDTILANIWRKAGRASKSPFIDAVMGYNPKYFQYQYDPMLSRKLLSEANLGHGFITSMTVDYELVAELERTGEAIKKALFDVGIRVNVINLKENEFRKACFEHDFELLLDPHTHQVPDGIYISWDDYGDEKWGIENHNQYFSNKVFILQQEAYNTLSEKERIKYVHQLQQVILDDAPQVYLLNINGLVAANKSIRALEWDVNGRIFFQNAYNCKNIPI
jgi:peptide/nickel transport system substrate-binding protein